MTHSTITLPTPEHPCDDADCERNAAAALFAAVLDESQRPRITARLACRVHVDDAVERWIFAPHVVVRLDDAVERELVRWEDAFGPDELAEREEELRALQADGGAA